MNYGTESAKIVSCPPHERPIFCEGDGEETTVELRIIADFLDGSFQELKGDPSRCRLPTMRAKSMAPRRAFGLKIEAFGRGELNQYID
jgi:hypothetical protein